MRITAFEWDGQNIAHMARHGVNPEEVEEACYNRPLVLRSRQGSYLVYSQTDDGRYLMAICRYRGQGRIYVITARDMTESERKFCQKKR